VKIVSRLGTVIDPADKRRGPSSSSETSEGAGGGCAIELDGALIFMHSTSERASPFVSTTWPSAHSILTMY
jgi:hypothetical protein